jgi:D-glycero-D-manno-heptose 1,7-bisphosphate phosphatase
MKEPRLALLDRDGTLNRKPPDGDYVTDASELELLPGAAEAVRALNRAGVGVAVVTNQRCIALGRLDRVGLERIHATLQAQLFDAAGARVDAFYHCPHHVGTCECRKPAPGMLAAAGRDFGTVPEETVVIGDAASDVEAGRRLGARTVQLTDGESAATATAPTLLDAVRDVLAGRCG